MYEDFQLKRQPASKLQILASQNRLVWLNTVHFNHEEKSDGYSKVLDNPVCYKLG